MKKISKMQWENYKNSPRGKQVIVEFEKLYKENVPIEDILALCKKYAPQYFINHGPSNIVAIKNLLMLHNDIIVDLLDKRGCEDEINSAVFYEQITDTLFGVNSNDRQQSDYKMFLADNMFISVMLYSYLPTLFLPNLWVMQYKYFKDIIKNLEIELPEEPLRFNYIDRCLYYLIINNAMFDYCEANGITEPAEICAFFYDYQMTLIKEQEENEEKLPTPAQAWFLVGTYGEIERNLKAGFWQANPDTKRGDILVFYEKAPTKSINAIYRAKSDGVADPFFLYYGNTYIGHKQPMPAISLDELKEHPYFKGHKLVHKNFQGGSGWPLNSEDYNQLRKIWANKGYDVATLPNLKAHEAPTDIDYTEKEAAVHKYQVLPLLKDMGWTEENGDILNQVTLHVGHGDTEKKGRTDISLHPYGANNKKAKVVIEEKYWMKNEAEIAETFDQGISYAKLQEATICVLCDKSQIIVYPKQKDGFQIEKNMVFYWDEMSNPDKFNELKKLLS